MSILWIWRVLLALCACWCHPSTSSILWFLNDCVMNYLILIIIVIIITIIIMLIRNYIETQGTAFPKHRSSFLNFIMQHSYEYSRAGLTKPHPLKVLWHGRLTLLNSGLNFQLLFSISHNPLQNAKHPICFHKNRRWIGNMSGIFLGR